MTLVIPWQDKNNDKEIKMIMKSGGDSSLPWQDKNNDKEIELMTSPEPAIPLLLILIPLVQNTPVSFYPLTHL